MSTVEKSIRLYAWKTNYQVFKIVQGEQDSRTFNIQLFSTTIPVDLTGCTVMLYAVKPDSNVVYTQCQILDVTNGLVSVTLDEQIGIIDGIVDCWIQVIGTGGSDLRFEGMCIEVSECDLARSVQSSSEFKAFLKQSAKIAEIDKEVKDARIGKKSLQAKEQSQDTEINSLKTRVENIIAHNNDTEGNTELIDMRVGTDGTVYPTAGDATRSQFLNLQNRLLNKVTQLYDYENVSEGYYISFSDGTIGLTNIDGRWYHINIPCIVGETIYLNWISSSLSITWLDENEQPLSSKHLHNVSEIPVPEIDGVAYISVPVDFSVLYDIVIAKEPLLIGARAGLNYGEEEYIYNLTKNKRFAEYLDGILTGELALYRNEHRYGSALLHFTSETLSEELLRWVNLSLNTSAADITLHDGMLTLAENDERILAYQPNSSRFIGLDKSSTSWYTLKTVEEKFTLKHKKVRVTLVNGVFSIVNSVTSEVLIKNDISSILALFDKISIGCGALYGSSTYAGQPLMQIFDTTTFIPYVNVPIITKNTEVSHWNDKIWYAYGTSLTSIAQGKYVPYVAELGGLNYVNKGIPGGGIITNRNIYNAVMAKDGKSEADLITLEVGANDSTQPLGTPLDTKNTTFCGSLNCCIKHLLETCPKAQVVIMTSMRGRYPHSNPDDDSYEINQLLSGGFTYDERDEAIRKCALLNGVYFIPFNQLGLGLHRMKNNDLYLVDNVHHTSLGGYNLAQGIWGYLKNIPLWYNEMP